MRRTHWDQEIPKNVLRADGRVLNHRLNDFNDRLWMKKNHNRQPMIFEHDEMNGRTVRNMRFAGMDRELWVVLCMHVVEHGRWRVREWDGENETNRERDREREEWRQKLVAVVQSSGGARFVPASESSLLWTESVDRWFQSKFSKHRAATDLLCCYLVLLYSISPAPIFQFIRQFSVFAPASSRVPKMCKNMYNLV